MIDCSKANAWTLQRVPNYTNTSSGYAYYVIPVSLQPEALGYNCESNKGYIDYSTCVVGGAPVAVTTGPPSSCNIWLLQVTNPDLSNLTVIFTLSNNYCLGVLPNCFTKGIQIYDIFQCPYTGSNIRNFQLTEIGPVVAPEPNLVISGLIKNLFDGTVIKSSILTANGISIKFDAVSDSSVFTATVNDESKYTVSLPKGEYSRTASMAGFIDATTNVKFTADSSSNSNDILISPTFTGWRIVLTWGATPKDLDGEVILTDGKRVNYTHPKSSDGTVEMDVDSKKGYGPETFTFAPKNGGVYSFFVNNYSRDAPLYKSLGKVTVYKDNKQLQEINIPNEQVGNNFYYWNVCKIDFGQGILIPVNTLTSTKP